MREKNFLFIITGGNSNASRKLPKVEKPEAVLNFSSNRKRYSKWLQTPGNASIPIQKVFHTYFLGRVNQFFRFSHSPKVKCS